MEIREISQQFLERVATDDLIVRLAIKDSSVKENILSELDKGFGAIYNYCPNLIEDIQNRVVRYNSQCATDKKPTDFITLIIWYSMSLVKHEVDYWDPSGKYYNLRTNEVINTFLMARYNLGVI